MTPVGVDGIDCRVQRTTEHTTSPCAGVVGEYSSVLPVCHKESGLVATQGQLVGNEQREEVDWLVPRLQETAHCIELEDTTIAVTKEDNEQSVTQCMYR